MLRVFLQSALVTAISCFSFSAQAVEVYMFKGAGDFSFVNENMHFSRGLNKMADKLNAEGIRAEVRRFGAMDQALELIRKRKPKSIAIVGHSMGALASLSMARSLQNDGVHIAYMALLDIPGPVGVASRNAAWVENYYTMNPVYGKLTNVRSHPRAKNIHVFGYIHNRLDDAPKVQNGILAAIREVHAAEHKELVPQPETLFVEAQPAVPQVASPEVEQAYQQPVTSHAPAPASPSQSQGNIQLEPYALPSVSTTPSIDPVTTSSIPQSSSPVPRVDVGQRVSSRVQNFLRRSDRSRAKVLLHSDSDR